MAHGAKNRSASKPSHLEVPKEHGFWVMLIAVLIDSVGRADWQAMAVGVAFATGVTAALVGGRLHRAIRRTPWAQLVSSASLGLLLFPAELAAGNNLRFAAMDALAWSSIFVGCSLAVRATFARAGRRNRSGPWSSIASILIPTGFALGLWALHYPVSARISAVGALGTIGIAIWRPLPKQLKAAGLALGAIVTLALTVHLVA